MLNFVPSEIEIVKKMVENRGIETLVQRAQVID